MNNCLNCNKETNNPKFCSNGCSAKYNNKLYPKRKAIKRLCLFCGLDITKTKNRKYCSRNHFIAHYELIRKTKNFSAHCLLCETKLTTSGHKNYRKKFCSNKCFSNYLKKEYLTRWINGDETGSMPSSSQLLSKYVRDYLLEKSEYKCSLCGWNEINKYTNKPPLEIDHIDGHSENNRPENLRVLCPNCHSLTEFYGILNKGSGRRRYKELYYRNKKQ